MNVKPIFLVLFLDRGRQILEPVAACSTEDGALSIGHSLAVEKWGDDFFQEGGVLANHAGCMTWTQGRDWRTRPDPAALVMVTWAPWKGDGA